MDFLIYFVISLVVIFVMYILLTFISLKKHQRKLVSFQEELKPNMEVVIAGGLYGKIKHLDERFANVTISDGVVVKVERYAIKQVV
jgi:preprotein translocase subunit YajC